MYGSESGDAFFYFSLDEAMDDVLFNSCDSSYDTYLRVIALDAVAGHDGHDAFEEVASCDDCGDCGTQTILSTGALPAGDYLLLVEVILCNVM